MKTISHPSQQYIPYTKVLHYLKLPIYFCYSVQNLWITALMISYSPPNILDSFMWITPIIISIIIRPYLITYIHKTFSPRQSQLSIIIYFLIVSMIGCAVIAYTCLWLEQEDYWGRIGLCMVGWTMMDVGLEIGEYFGDKTKDRLGKLGYQVRDDGVIVNAGSYFGYAVSLVLCLLKGGKTMKKFHLQTGYIYTLSSTLLLLYTLLLHTSCKDPLTLTSQLLPKQSIQLVPATSSTSIVYYLPGYHQLMNSYGYDRWLIILHFCYLFIVDCLLIYGSMWIVMVYVGLGEKEGVGYNLGMKEGAILLLIYTFFSKTNITKWLTPNNTHTSDLKLLTCQILLISLCSTLLFNYYNHNLIYLLSCQIGIMDNLYNTKIYPYLQQNNLVFNSTYEIVNRLQKLFILCPMPFIVMIVLGRDDLSDVFLALPAVVAVMLGYGYVRVWRVGQGRGIGGRVTQVDKDL